MSNIKITTTTTTILGHEERLYSIPLMTPEEKARRQRDTMTSACRFEALAATGYEPVPIAALREDASILKLLDMMETTRSGGSEGEEAFIKNYLDPFNPFVDDYGNHIISVPPPEDATDTNYPNILWSVHTDSVHRTGGGQKVEVTDGIAWTPDGTCLGADDAVGVWLALEMIIALVPGTYVFHREEESGGGGSRFMARHNTEWVGSFDAAIALDRMGYADVITHQGGGRCCSDEFATSLATLLGGKFAPCDGGVFTDTANYVDLIGECTNLSVGYFRQHGPAEITNLGFAYRLRDALVAADWSKLVLKRQPGEVDVMDMWAYDDKWGTHAPRKAYSPAKAYGDSAELAKLEQFCSDFPWVVAAYLQEMGVDAEELDLYEPEAGW